ncbi:hypothetical protein BS47DRAFT_328886 [Hydnum rufescens UP504]|uniref:Uncharacterized protein n=1 Tax=Hydnum rufescens UP504 TaxID=1448309 RepID=A0A9P6B5W2_9AGAM|nr:hypothetical protein BS47DRAFT_328886 [Hydnum rufescens UP504]
MSLAAATSFSNAVVISSRAHRSAGPFRIQFESDWQSSGIMDWHHSLGPRPTKINTLQLRRQRSKGLKHQDDKAQRYTLQRFNCYFFSWTMFVVTARHAVPWDNLPFDSLWETLSETLADALSTRFADALIDMIVDGAVIIVMAIQLRLKRQLRRAVSRRARLPGGCHSGSYALLCG